MKRKRRPVNRLSIWELIDWYCPVYVEYKPGSTDLAATCLTVSGLRDGRYIWQISYRRERFMDGARCDWRIGQSSDTVHNLPCDSFEQALELARESLEIANLPIWRIP